MAKLAEHVQVWPFDEAAKVRMRPVWNAEDVMPAFVGARETSDAFLTVVVECVHPPTKGPKLAAFVNWQRLATSMCFAVFLLRTNLSLVRKRQSTSFAWEVAYRSWTLMLA